MLAYGISFTMAAIMAGKWQLSRERALSPTPAPYCSGAQMLGLGLVGYSAGVGERNEYEGIWQYIASGTQSASPLVAYDVSVCIL
jgi:hypothetical protein